MQNYSTTLVEWLDNIGPLRNRQIENAFSKRRFISLIKIGRYPKDLKTSGPESKLK